MPSALIAAVLVFATAFTGSRYRPGDWYAGLAKPSWTPPGWVFAPVWTLLYIAIAVAGWLAWRASRRIDPALCFWLAQLVFNAGWSWLFFGRHRPGAAVIDIVLLLACIVGFIVAVRPVSAAAAILFVPYGAWVAFASLLNVAIWRLNAGGRP